MRAENKWLLAQEVVAGRCKEEDQLGEVRSLYRQGVLADEVRIARRK